MVPGAPDGGANAPVASARSMSSRQTAHAHALGMTDPRAAVARRGRLEQQRDERMRLHPGEPSRGECLAQRCALGRRARDAQQGARAARRHAEALLGIGIEARVTDRAREPEHDHPLEPLGQACEPPRLEAHRAAQACVELEGVGGVEIARERGDERGGAAVVRSRVPRVAGSASSRSTCVVWHRFGARIGRARRVVGHRPRAGPLGRLHDLRLRRHRFGVFQRLALEPHRGEHLGRHRLGELRKRERVTGHPIGDLARVPPARAHLGRAAHDHADAPLVVLFGAANTGRGVARALIHPAHLARECRRGEARGEGEPLVLVLRLRDATHEAQLGPAELARDERLLEPRQRSRARDRRGRDRAARAATFPRARRHSRRAGRSRAAPSRAWPPSFRLSRASARRSGPDARARA